MDKKELIAKVLDKTYLSRLLFAGKRYYGNNHIRVVNYHDTPPGLMKSFERQLQFFQQKYAPVSYCDLVQFCTTNKWHKPKPGLIISFDDGWRDNLDNAVPLLEKYNFIGWFFVPAGMIEAGSTEQMEFVGKTEGRYKITYEDGRYLMSWDELKTLCKNHVVGCHTFSHHRMNIKDSGELLHHEITEPKLLMEKRLGKKVDIYCWVGGEEHTYTTAAAQKIKDSGYAYSFMTNSYPLTIGQDPLQIQRTNVEARFSLARTRFQLSIIMDTFYSAKRKRVIGITKIH
jgi:peptidoglycan/xylan/chitin deacetylase (PgdA/CDA1 family)